MLNCVNLIGRLVREPEVFGAESTVTKITLAVDHGFGDKKTTSFIPVTLFGKKGEYCQNYVDKGSLVCVSGWLNVGTYTKKDGSKATSIEVVADDVWGLERKSEAPKGTQRVIPQGFEVAGEDVPF